jgi:hypothetical protein
MSQQCIYVLSNPYIRGVKIGMTSNGIAGVQERMKNLRTTGVPGKFKCEFAAEVENSLFLEKDVHHFLSEHRCELDREFFDIPVPTVKFLIDIRLKGEVKDVTQQVSEPLSQRTKQEAPKPEKSYLADILFRKAIDGGTASVEGLVTNLDLQKRYNICKQTLYTRMQTVSVRSTVRMSNRAFYTDDQVALLDKVDELLKRGHTLGSVSMILVNND